jgi:hypothetical protein
MIMTINTVWCLRRIAAELDSGVEIAPVHDWSWDSAISARDAVPTIQLERFVQTLYNSKVSESVEELLELC